MVEKKRFEYFSYNGNHEDLAKTLSSGYELSSALVNRKHLFEVLSENPKYVKIKTCVLSSEVEEIARKRIGNSYTDIEEVRTYLFDRWQNPIEANNMSSEEDDRKYQSEMIDLFYDGEIKSFYPEIIEEFKESFWYHYDEEKDEKTLKTEEEFERTWPTELRRILAPRTQRRWERIYDMPEPFNHWDSRNLWEQYFFIRPLISDPITFYCHGGSASSHQRYVQGLMGHTFCLLEHKYGLTIPMDIYCYNESNEFTRTKRYARFKTMNLELSGNYKVDLAYHKDHLKGRLLRLNFETYEFEECRENEI